MTLGISLAAGLGVVGIVATNQSASAAPVAVDDPREAAVKISICEQVEKAVAAGDPPVSTCEWQNIRISNPADAKSVVVGDENNALKFVNCGDGILKETVTWSRSSDMTRTFAGGIAFEGEVDAIFVKFDASATYSHGHELANGKTYTASTLLEVPPGETGWITHSEKRMTGTGDLFLKQKDAGEFLMKDIKFDGPVKDSNGAIGTHTRKHTASDAAVCASAPAPIVVEGTEPTGKLVRADGSDLPDVG